MSVVSFAAKILRTGQRIKPEYVSLVCGLTLALSLAVILSIEEGNARPAAARKAAAAYQSTSSSASNTVFIVGSQLEAVRLEMALLDPELAGFDPGRRPDVVVAETDEVADSIVEALWQVAMENNSYVGPFLKVIDLRRPDAAGPKAE